MGDGGSKITPADVQEARAELRKLQESTNRKSGEASAFDLGTPGSQGQLHLQTHDIRLRNAEFRLQDLQAEYASQEQAAQVASATRLAITNTRLAWAISVAAAVQAIAAIAQAYYAARGGN